MTRFIALFMALVAGIGVAVWYYRAAETGSGTPAPFAVRTDDKWLDDLRSRNPKEVEAATAAIEERGTAALPVIRRTLQDSAADPSRRKAALKACAILGVRAAEAIPDVATLLPQTDYTPEAALALSFMGSAAVPTLEEALDSDDPVVRREALRSLGKVRERAQIDPQLVIPRLLKALDDPDASVRETAVTYLGIVRDEPQKEVAALVKALADDEPSVRAGAATALGSYGPAAASSVPALKKATRDPDEDVQREAGRALLAISEPKG
jgi:HEAT repeat protein